MSVFTHLSLSPINIAAALCSAKAYNSAYAKGEQMINETMYARGAESSIIREIFSYGLERKAQIGAENVFDFSLGNPSVPAPAAVAESIKKALELPSDQLHGYTPAPGLPQCRAAVAESLNRRFGTSYEGKDVFMTVGAAASLTCTLNAVANPGDEVIVFSPYFALYRAQIELAGGVCVDVPTYAEEDYAISEERLRAAITPRTKAIIFNNPTNPTGMGYDLSTMEMLARVAKEYDLLIAADEIYTTYIYEGDFRPIRTLPGMAERTITLNSFSKNFLMTGWRVGVIIAEPELLEVMHGINGSLVYSAPSISQRAGIQALAMRKEIREKYVTAYRDRIFYSADRIEKIPYLSLVRPKGTFYLFPGVEKTGLDDKQFCKELLERAHVLVSAGSPFGKTGANHFRIACTVGIDQLKQAFDRMEKLEF